MSEKAKYVTFLMGERMSYPRYAVTLYFGDKKFAYEYSIVNPHYARRIASDAEYTLWLAVRKDLPESFVACCDLGWVPQKLVYLKDTV